ncbi:MAG: pyridoxal-phosphate dependent enzyme [Sulfolobales archaeon]
MKIFWFCPKCGFRDELWREYYYKCPRCGAPLELSYPTSYRVSGNKGLYRFESMLPFTPERSRGEASTPLVVEKEGGHYLLYKLEYLNPSGSFKDRGTSLSIYYAFKRDFREVVEDTSGNTGISVALYSTLYGLRARILMPKTAPEGKKRIIKMLSGEIVETSSRAEASERVVEYAENSYYVAHTWSPFYVIGASTISYEVFEDYGVPDVIIAPIGSGGLFLGLARGFENLLREGKIRKMPRLVGVQGYSAQPVYEKLYGSKAVGEDSSLADGIMVQNPPRLSEIIDIIRRYDGEVVLVGNTEIKRAWEELLERGFIVEPTSAVVYAAFLKIRDKIEENSKILLPLTGSGLKLV